MKPKFDPALPIYTQIMEWFKRLILSGKLSPGEKVPPVRELALQLGVNPNTLQRAMSELEREGLLYTERTAGRFVTEDSALIASLREELIRQVVGGFLEEVRALGYEPAEAERLIKKYGGETE
ncbi:MAG: GntR family transcriptional regulator [Firmicutes bacterium]|nr:GntR family transcriptional regulator [Bacillota bacterium]